MADPILSHATYMAVGIIAIMLIIATVFTLQEDNRQINEVSKLNYYITSIENKILELSSISSDNFEAQIKINVPERYLVKMSGNILSVSGDEFIAEKEIPIYGYGGGYGPIYLIFTDNEVVIAEGVEIISELIELPPLEIGPTPIRP